MYLFKSQMYKENWFFEKLITGGAINNTKAQLSERRLSCVN